MFRQITGENGLSGFAKGDYVDDNCDIRWTSCLPAREPMTPNRFFDETADGADRLSPPTQGAFYWMAVAAGDVTPASPLQWLYQKMYDQAQQASQPPKTRDLFAVMN
jgi:hypothetical protein